MTVIDNAQRLTAPLQHCHNGALRTEVGCVDVRLAQERTEKERCVETHPTAANQGVPGLLDAYVFGGIVGNASWAAVKRIWAEATGKTWDQLYFDAFPQAVEDSRDQLKQYAKGKHIEIDNDALQKALVRTETPGGTSGGLSQVADEAYVTELAGKMAAENVLEIEGHNLSPDDYSQVLRNLARRAHALFWNAIVSNDTAFREAVLREFQQDRLDLEDLKTTLGQLEALSREALSRIEAKTDHQTELLETYLPRIPEIQQGVERIEKRLDETAVNAVLDEILSRDAATPAETVSEPVPPEAPLPAVAALPPDFVPAYPLQANFTGRVKERKALTTWFMAKKDPVYALVAIGGMGKSALTWVWLLQDVLGQREFGAEACQIDEADRPEGVLWWSFYDTRATFPAFLERAIAYASGGAIDPKDIPSESERVDTLLDLLRERPILLVLDGLERRLRAYARLDAAYQGDAVDETQASLRECIDPHFATFLASVASTPMPSRILITSRLMPRELEGADDNPLDGCCKEKLEGFDPADAVAFFRTEGIQGTRAEIEAACGPYDYHPLALGFLAGVIKKDRRTPNDIRVAARHPVTADLKGRAKHHILVVAYDELNRTHRKLLSQIAAFRNPIAYETLAILNPYKAGKREQKFNTALDELVDRGLLLFDAPPEGGPAQCDLHPIVRQHAYGRLTDKQGVHTRLRDHFSAVPAPEDSVKVARLEDLNPIIELYHHTVRAGQLDEAFRLFRDRLSDVLYFRFGAYQTGIELLCALFPGGEPLTHDGKAVLPLLEDEDDQAWSLNDLACSYGLSGQPRCAVPLTELSNVVDERRGNETGVAIGLGNLAQQNMLFGQLAAAERNIRRRIHLCREIKDEWQEAVGHRELGRLLAYQGTFGEAGRELDQAGKVFKGRGHSQSEGLATACRALRSLLMGNGQDALEASRRALELWHATARTQFPYERDRVEVEWLLGWASTALADEEPAQASDLLAEAETHLTDAITRCRRINMVDHEPDILLAWARWHRAKSNAPAAYALAVEALGIADRCEYRLKQAEIHNFLARLALDAGDRATARDHAQRARDYAWCDGPPHCYKPALDEAERMLEEVASG